MKYMRLKHLRIDILNISQEEFISRIGKNTDYFGYISRFESGERKPSLGFLFGMVKNLGVQPNWFFLGTGDYYFSYSEKINFKEFQNIFQRIEILRTHIGVSIRGFVKIIGMPIDTFYCIKKAGFFSEKSKKFVYLENIIELLGVSPNWLILGIGEMFYDEYRTNIVIFNHLKSS